MENARFPSMPRVARLFLLGLLAASQAFAGMPGGGYSYRFPTGGFGGYHYRFGGPYYGPHYGYYGRARWYGGPRWGWGVGFYLPVLPLGCVSIAFGGGYWYYGGGYWYQPSGAGFVVAYPPPGIMVTALPPGCVPFTYGGVTYYTANSVYYTAAPGGSGYIVSQAPPEQAVPVNQPAPGTPDAEALDALVVIPHNGQDEAKALADRRDAQRYAMNHTGYDPARSDASDPGTPRARQAYLKSLKSYLEARGYTVR